MSWFKRFLGIASKYVAKDSLGGRRGAASTGPTAQVVSACRPKLKNPDDIHCARMDRIATDEADTRRLGIPHLYMHISALSPTTRPTHAARHGNLYTEEEMQEWWSKDGNDVECRCSVVTILLDENGNPLTPSIIERARKTYEDIKAKGNGEWTKI